MEVSAVLAYLRSLQTEHEVAILVVHHARKSGGNGSAAGLALRGSGDFWAWGDSNLYLRRKQGALQLTIEHRSAAPPDPIALELCSDGPYLRLRSGPTEAAAPAQKTLSERILELMGVLVGPHKLDELRSGLRVRMQTLIDTLRELESDKRVQRVSGGWHLIDSTRNQPGETEAGNAEEHPAEG